MIQPQQVLERRKAMGLTQEALARKSRSSLATVNRLERKGATRPAAAGRRVLKALGIEQPQPKAPAAQAQAVQS